MSFIVHPTYRSGFAAPKRMGAGLTFRNPSLWRGCVGAWCPSLGATGNVLFDHSGYGLNGTLTTMDAATDWVASDGQLVLDFDGTDDYVVAGSNAIHTSERMSVSIWVKCNASPNSYDGIIAKTNGGLWTEGWGMYWATSAIMNFWAGTYATNYSDNQTAVTATAWNHFVGVADGVNVTLWFNGTRGTARTQGASLLTTPASKPLEFCRVGGNAYNTNGQLDDIRIYNRALKDSEILTLRQRRGIAYEGYRSSQGISVTASSKLPGSVIINQAVMHASNF